jgi:DNA polymerase V
MGEPFFKRIPLMERSGVRVFSSNYVLYGDMSRRVNEVLNRFTPEVETYSIDETFLDWSDFDGRDLWRYAQDMRATVRQ